MPEADLKIVTTADGSKTIWNEQVGEHYHSRNGALQESRHVFLNAGLEHFLSGNEVNEVSVLEVGFGTGLNFLLTADHCATHHIKLDYTGIEAYPLSQQMIAETGYEEYIRTETWDAFLQTYQQALYHQTVLNDFVTLEIAPVKLDDFNSDKLYDVIYFDAFAVAHQPEMWTEQAIAHTVKFLRPGGVFVTYAITGNLKRTMKGLGLKIEKVPGAPGKREMLRARL